MRTGSGMCAVLLPACVCVALITGCGPSQEPVRHESPAASERGSRGATAPDNLTGTDAPSLMDIVERARQRKLASERSDVVVHEAQDTQADAAADEAARRRELFAEEHQAYLQLKQLYDSGFVTQEELASGWEDLCRRWNVAGAGSQPAWLLWNAGTGTVELGGSETPRFIDNGNGTVTDRRTGLVWLQNASAVAEMSWQDAVDFCAGLAGGTHGLSDGSVAGQWRLPGIGELQSLGTDPPASWKDGRSPVPWTMPGEPFMHVRPLNYRSGTTYANDGGYAWYLNMRTGFVRYNLKSRRYFVWPVRGGAVR